MQNKEDSFIGTSFETVKGGALTVIECNGLVEPKKRYICECSLCSSDKELFPYGTFSSSKAELNRGRFPCACSKYRYSEEQAKILINRWCETHDYTFIKFCSDYKMSSTKILLYNNNVKDICKPFTLKRLYAGEFPSCVNHKAPSALRKDEYTYIQEFRSSGNFPDDVSFKLAEIKCKGNYNRYWEYYCPRCDEDFYSTNNVSSGVFKTTLPQLYSGNIPCRCSGSYAYTLEECQFSIEHRLKGINGKFISFEKGHRRRDYFFWMCERGHLCKSSVDGFIIKGYGCDDCRKLYSTNNFGYYPERSSDTDTLYLVEFTLNGERFCKIGRTFNMDNRYTGKLKSSIKILYTEQNTHNIIFNKEQAILREFKKLKYVPQTKFSGSSKECFNIDAKELLLDYLLNVDVPAT